MIQNNSDTSEKKSQGLHRSLKDSLSIFFGPLFWKAGFFLGLLIILSLVLYIKLGDRCNRIDIISLPRYFENQKEIIYPEIDAWESYSSPDGTYSFKYPKEWILKVSDTGKEVQVSNKLENCKLCNAAEAENYYAFSIEFQEQQEDVKKTTNALIYQLSNWLDFELEEDQMYKNCQKEGKVCLPTTPGFTEFPLGRLESPPFTNSRASAIRVYPFSVHADYAGIAWLKDQVVTHEYILIDKNYRVYQIGLVSPGYNNSENLPEETEKEHPLVKIATSLKFGE